MAYIYYPTSASLMTRTVSGSGYSEVNIGVAPNSIFVFDTVSIGTASLVDTASYAITASYAVNGGGGGTSLETGSTYPFTSSEAISASYAANGGGGGSFLTLTDTPSTYAGYANNVVMVDSASTGLTFGGVPTGLAVVYSTQSILDGRTSSSFARGVSTYTRLCYKLQVIKPIKLNSIGYLVPNPGTCSLYLSNDWTGSQIVTPVFISQSVASGSSGTYISGTLDNRYFWLDDGFYLTFVWHEPPRSVFAYDTVNTEWSGSYLRSPNQRFLISSSGQMSFNQVNGVPPAQFAVSPYDSLGQYGVNVFTGSYLYVTSSEATTASYALTASYAANGGGGGTDIVMVQMFI